MMGAKNSSEKKDIREAQNGKNKIKPMKFSSAQEHSVGAAGGDTFDGDSDASTTHISSAAFAHVLADRKKVEETKRRIAKTRYQDYVYPFENLVFEGGGAKGQVYVGCLQVRD